MSLSPPFFFFLSENLNLMDILENPWPVLFKNVKGMKNKQTNQKGWQILLIRKTEKRS